MKILILLSIAVSLIAFQNCSDASFSDSGSTSAGKVGEVGPPLDEVPPEDQENTEEYYSCEDDDSSSSDDMDSVSSDDNDKVLVCHNGHVICISDQALEAHLSVHQDMHQDVLVSDDNYGACADDDSESSDDTVESDD